MIRKVVIWIMLLWALAAALLAPLAIHNRPVPMIDDVVFAPTQYPVGNWKPKDLVFEDVYFENASGIRLHGWLCPVVDPRATILLVHGNAGNVATRVELLKALQQMRLTTFVFDYQGFGRSAGRPTVTGAVEDTRAARDRLCKLAQVKSSEILLLGTSVGGAIAIEVASDQKLVPAAKPKGAILVSTFTSLFELAAQHYPGHEQRVPDGLLDTASKIGTGDFPLLIVHGDQDKVVPLEMGEKLFELAEGSKKLVILPGVEHDVGKHPVFLAALDAFLLGLSEAAK